MVACDKKKKKEKRKRKVKWHLNKRLKKWGYCSRVRRIQWIRNSDLLKEDLKKKLIEDTKRSWFSIINVILFHFNLRLLFHYFYFLNIKAPIWSWGMNGSKIFMTNQWVWFKLFLASFHFMRLLVMSWLSGFHMIYVKCLILLTLFYSYILAGVPPIFHMIYMWNVWFCSHYSTSIYLQESPISE